MSTTNKIYLSGPMRGHENQNHKAFDNNATFLRDKGWDVFSPAEADRELGIDASHDPSEDKFRELIKHDYAALLDADAIAFMPGWGNSIGAKMESNFANMLKLDRYRVDAHNSYFEKELVLAFCGYARSGKNTIAEEFITNNGFEQRGFSDPLKESLYELNPIIQRDTGFDFVRLQYLIDEDGWEQAKSISDVRQSLQHQGDGCRKSFGGDICINTLFDQPHKARLVIPDLRFVAEAEEVRRRGGVVIRVIRDGVGPVNDHASDQINFETDITVYNNGTPKEAYMNIIEQLPEFGIEL